MMKYSINGGTNAKQNEKNKTKTYLGNACYFNIFYTWNDIKTDKKGYMDSSRKW